VLNFQFLNLHSLISFDEFLKYSFLDAIFNI
jgi:hypothetical protein